MGLSKNSNTVTKANSSSEFFHAVSSSVFGLSQTYHTTKSMRNTEWVLRNTMKAGFHEPVKFTIFLIIQTKSAVYIKWFVTVNAYIVQVITLRYSTKLLPYTYTLRVEIRNNQNCSSLLHSHRFSCDDLHCWTQEVEI